MAQQTSPNASNMFKGRIENGVILLENAKLYNDKVMSLEGKEIELDLKRYYKKRSNQHNRYYRVCLKHISEITGYDEDELHNTFKAMFCVDRSGKIPIVKSTAKLNSLEFTEYIEKIARRVALIDIILPSPNEYFNY